MKILLGVQTTGNGHIVRSSTLLSKLRARGHDVYCLLSGPTIKQRWKTEQFEPCETHTGLSFASRAGKLSYWHTIWENKPLQFLNAVRQLDWRDYDLVISDYEPITAWMARRRGLPSIGIGHLYAFIHDVPKSPGNHLAHWVTNTFAPVKYAMGSHWHHFDQPLLPPTVADDVYALTPSEGEHFLVYLPFEKQGEVLALLKQFPDQLFKLYTGTPEQGQVDNVQLCKIDRQGFIDDLASSRGVIGNAGFSLASEALHLGKKLLVKPLTGQVEQESNAVALEQLKLGHWMAQLNADSVSRWLEMPAVAPCNWPEVMEPLADWISAGDWENHQALTDTLWSDRQGNPQS